MIDGAVNGTRHLTVGTSFFSGLFDLNVVDGAVNLVAKIYELWSRAPCGACRRVWCSGTRS